MRESLLNLHRHLKNGIEDVGIEQKNQTNGGTIKSSTIDHVRSRYGSFYYPQINIIST